MPREQFRNAGIHYEVCEYTKSELYIALLPLINSRAVMLLEDKRLISQLVALERRVHRSGRDSIDHPQRGGHDDVVNSAAGALCAGYRSAPLVGDGGIGSRRFRHRKSRPSDMGLRAVAASASAVRRGCGGASRRPRAKDVDRSADACGAASWKLRPVVQRLGNSLGAIALRSRAVHGDCVRCSSDSGAACDAVVVGYGPASKVLL